LSTDNVEISPLSRPHLPKAFCPSGPGGVFFGADFQQNFLFLSFLAQLSSHCHRREYLKKKVSKVGTNAAACRVDVDFVLAAARSSVGGAAVCQVMDPGPSGVVLSSLIEGAIVAANRPRHDLVPTPPLFM